MDKFHVGNRSFQTRPAAIYPIEAARLMCRAAVGPPWSLADGRRRAGGARPATMGWDLLDPARARPVRIAVGIPRTRGARRSRQLERIVETQCTWIPVRTRYQSPSSSST